MSNICKSNKNQLHASARKQTFVEKRIEPNTAPTESKGKIPVILMGAGFEPIFYAIYWRHRIKEIW